MSDDWRDDMSDGATPWTMSVLPWVIYAALAAAALVTGWHDGMLRFDGPLAGVKGAVWLTLVGFLAYSIHCSTRAHLLRTLRSMAASYWGRQIAADLYIGLGLTMLVMYLHEGSLLVVALWLVPVVVYANLATLLYVAIHFDSLVARFIG